MLEAPSRATLDLMLTTMFWRAPPERDADELLGALATVGENEVDTAEHISIWLQEERDFPAAAAEDIADRYIARVRAR